LCIIILEEMISVCAKVVNQINFVCDNL